MLEVSYTILEPLGYKKGASRQLSESLADLGFTHVERIERQFEKNRYTADSIFSPEIAQVLASIDIKGIWVGVASSVLYDTIKTIIVSMYHWHKKNKKTSNNSRPYINIYIQNQDENFFLQCDVSKQYSQGKLTKLIDASESKLQYQHTEIRVQEKVQEK